MSYKKLSKKGQIEAGKSFIFGLLALGIGLAFFLVFQSNLFQALPTIAGTAEANASIPLRSNLTGISTTVSAGLPNLASLGLLVLVIGALALAWAFFKRSELGGNMGSY